MKVIALRGPLAIAVIARNHPTMVAELAPTLGHGSKFNANRVASCYFDIGPWHSAAMTQQRFNHWTVLPHLLQRAHQYWCDYLARQIAYAREAGECIDRALVEKCSASRTHQFSRGRIAAPIVEAAHQVEGSPTTS